MKRYKKENYGNHEITSSMKGKKPARVADPQSANFATKRRFLMEKVICKLLPKLDRKQWLVGVGMKEAKRFARSLDKDSAHSKVEGSYYDIRSSTYLAVALAETGDVATAARIVMRILDYQDLRPKSISYGNFFWRSDWSEVKDPNCASFIIPYLAHLAVHHRQAFTAEELLRLESALELGAEALFMHRSTWGYTNIALLNIAGKLAVGSLLRNDRLVRLAYWDWEEWRNHTARSGLISEWYSNTYTEVQIDALAMMLACPNLSPIFLKEVRAVLQQLLTQVILDFHPGIGRITGPQSRAYEPDRKWKHRSIMDIILYLLYGDQAYVEENTCLPWIGAEISEADLLPTALNLPLPRTTVQTSDFLRRTNYLAADYALGSIQMHTHLMGAGLPFFLIYKSTTSRCGMGIIPNGTPDGYWSEQRDGNLLAAVTWVVSRKPSSESLSGLGRMSGLMTNRPDNVNDKKGFCPEFSVELGMADRLQIADETGKDVKIRDGQMLHGEALGIETETIRVFLRFTAGKKKPPMLRLEVTEDGNTVLKVKSGDNVKVINRDEALAIFGFQLRVEPLDKAKSFANFVREKAAMPCAMCAKQGGWAFDADFGATIGRLQLHIPATLNTFCNTCGMGVTANQWALSLRAD